MSYNKVHVYSPSVDETEADFFFVLKPGDWCDRCYDAYPAVLAFSNKLDQISMFTSWFCQTCVFLNPFKFREENKVMK